MTEDLEAMFKPRKWPVQGDHVRFTGEGGYDSENRTARKILRIGGVYRVANCDVYAYDHRIQLAEHPGRQFNGVMFELVESQPQAAP